jgi:hypothetical protein
MLLLFVSLGSFLLGTAVVIGVVLWEMELRAPYLRRRARKAREKQMPLMRLVR